MAFRIAQSRRGIRTRTSRGAAGIAARLVRSYPPRQEALTRRLSFAGFQQQVVRLMDANSIIIVVVIVLIVLFVLGYFGRGRFRG
jgi:hypothetical protein